MAARFWFNPHHLRRRGAAFKRHNTTERDLTTMIAGQKGRVVAIEGGMTARLEGLGIRLGVEIIKISNQIMHGPVIVRIGSTQVAIGFGMARRIIVEPVEIGQASGA
jgi:ferrous iron transport protein A